MGLDSPARNRQESYAFIATTLTYFLLASFTCLLTYSWKTGCDVLCNAGVIQ